MLFEPRTVQLKDGRTALLRPAELSDAGAMIQLMVKLCGETDFILNYPEEFAENYTVEREEAFIAGQRENPNSCFITVEVEGQLAGNCNVMRYGHLKDMHRAGVAIAIAKDCWNIGLGTAMFELMLEIARGWGCTQAELDFVEGNVRARALYEKMGFAIVGVKPDAIRLKDGTMLREYSMVKKL